MMPFSIGIQFSHAIYIFFPFKLWSNHEFEIYSRKRDTRHEVSQNSKRIRKYTLSVNCFCDPPIHDYKKSGADNFNSKKLIKA